MPAERRQSRRKLLSGLASTAAAFGAGVVARATPASAATGDALVLGSDNYETEETHLQNNFVGDKGGLGHAFVAKTDQPNGAAGLRGVNTSQERTGVGVSGVSDYGTGVDAQSQFNSGLNAYGYEAGVVAQSAQVGVFASASQVGVKAQNGGPTGTAVQADSLNGGTGLLATTQFGGTAIHALVKNSGVALQVDGEAIFSRSGVVTVPKGASKASIGEVVLHPQSLVLATLQQNRASRWVRAAVPSAARGTITIYLNQAVTADTRVAWFVLN
jgi:hypothetical protein